MIEIPMTEDQFRAAGERLQRFGVALVAPSGTISQQGVTARYEFGAGQLRIAILQKPFFLSESMIEGRLKAYIEQNMQKL